MHNVLQSPGEPLDISSRAFFEPRFGQDFSSVRVHSGVAAARSARQLNARAYTVGDQIVFGAGGLAPATPEGRGLLAHELTHVVQFARNPAPGASRLLARLADRETPVTATQPPSPASTTASRPNLPKLADQIFKAIEGLGTDEEAVYRALQQLNRDQALIDELKEVYWSRHKVSLLEDIRDDFSGSELEFALQLLNLGEVGSAQRIETGAASTDPKAAARRLWDAFEVFMGTDEEAAFAALLPFRRDTLKVQRSYQEMFGEDLRDRIENEMSGSELAYALDLLETPFERYMQEAATWLKRFPSIGFGLPWKSADWFDGRFWRTECSSKECKLVLKAGKPHEAIDALFHEQGRWRVDCAVFVEVVRLYALRQSLGAKRFDARVGSAMELRAHGSSGNVRHVLFKRGAPDAAFGAEGAGAPARISDPDELLGDAPVGSRVRWTSKLLYDKANDLFGAEVFTAELEEWVSYQHENTIKLGPDRYGAQGVRGARVSGADIETKLVDITSGVFPDKPISEIRAGIFISELEIFERPELSDQIEPTSVDSEKGPRL